MTDEPSNSLIVPEFSRPVTVESLKIGKSERKITATPEECASLAKRFNLLALDNLNANLILIRKGQGGSARLAVSGRLNATVCQSCVITLDPVSMEIDTEFAAMFDIAAGDDQSESDVDLQIDDDVEPIIEGIVDLGELVAQNLAVEIDPFPRKEDADSSEIIPKTTENDANPFSVLKKLKNSGN